MAALEGARMLDACDASSDAASECIIVPRLRGIAAQAAALEDWRPPPPPGREVSNLRCARLVAGQHASVPARVLLHSAWKLTLVRPSIRLLLLVTSTALALAIIIAALGARKQTQSARASLRDAPAAKAAAASDVRAPATPVNTTADTRGAAQPESPSSVVRLGAALGAAVGAAVAECAPLEEVLSCNAVACDELSAGFARHTGATLRAHGIITCANDEPLTAGDGRAYVDSFCTAFRHAVASGSATRPDDSRNDVADALRPPVSPAMSTDVSRGGQESPGMVGDSQPPSGAELALQSPSRMAMSPMVVGTPVALHPEHSQLVATMAVHAMAIVGQGVHDLHVTLREANELSRAQLSTAREQQRQDAVRAGVRGVRVRLSDSLALAFCTTCACMTRRALLRQNWAARMHACVAREAAADASFAFTSAASGARGMSASTALSFTTWVMPIQFRELTCMFTLALGAVQSYLLLLGVLYTCVGPVVLRLPMLGAGDTPLSVTHMLCAACLAYFGGGAVISGLGGEPGVWYAAWLPLALIHLWGQVDTIALHSLLGCSPKWANYMLWTVASVMWPALALEGAFL